MFENLIRELRSLEGMHRISVSLPLDEDGYFDRECPSQECLCQFKVQEDDWRDKVRDEEVFCAFCGYTADSKQWWTQEQLKQGEKVALAEFERRIGGAMKRDAQSWNRRQASNSFIRITIKVDDVPRQVFLPSSAAEPMRLKITCPACRCRRKLPRQVDRSFGDCTADDALGRNVSGGFRPRLS